MEAYPRRLIVPESGRRFSVPTVTSEFAPMMTASIPPLKSPIFRPLEPAMDAFAPATVSVPVLTVTVPKALVLAPVRVKTLVPPFANPIVPAPFWNVPAKVSLVDELRDNVGVPPPEVTVPVPLMRLIVSLLRRS